MHGGVPLIYHLEIPLPPQPHLATGHGLGLPLLQLQEQGGRPIAIALQLTSVCIISMGLCKLQGQVVTHFEKVVWWKSFMVECVTDFSCHSYTPGDEAVNYLLTVYYDHLGKNFLPFLVSLELPLTHHCRQQQAG